MEVEGAEARHLRGHGCQVWRRVGQHGTGRLIDDTTAGVGEVVIDIVLKFSTPDRGRRTGRWQCEP